MESLKETLVTACSTAWAWITETTWGLLAVLFTLYAVVGTFEYREQRTLECEDQGLVWEQQRDTCQKEVSK